MNDCNGFLPLEQCDPIPHLSRAYLRGNRAYELGKNSLDNPASPGTIEFEDWLAGFTDALFDNEGV